MTAAAIEQHAAHVPRRAFRAAVEFAVRGDLRFLSHHDQMRMLARAVVRAAWPIAYSAGFNPRPQLNLPMPRSVGVASERELALIDLIEPRDAGELFAALWPAMPADAPLLSVRVGVTGKSPVARLARFEVGLDSDHTSEIPARISALMQAQTLPIERRANPSDPARVVDVRPFIESLLMDGALLRLSLQCDGQRTARPSEILMLLELPVDRYAHHVRRVEVEWNQELRGETECRRSEERTCFGNQESLGQARDATSRREG